MTVNVILFSLGISLVLSMALVFQVWGQRSTSGKSAVLIAALMMAVIWWTVFYGLEIASNTDAVKLFCYRARFLAVVFVPVIWLLFGFQYTGRLQWVTPKSIALLCIFPCATTVLIWTNQLHGLMWPSVGVATYGNLSLATSTTGIWFWLHSAYSYVLIMTASYFLFRQFAGSPGLYRRQIAALLIAVAGPMIANVITIFGSQPIDYTPFAHAIVVMSRAKPDELVAVRIGNAGGVALGLGQGENFIASDIPAILEHTRQMIFLESRQIATITADAIHIQTLDGQTITGDVHNIPYDPITAAKGEFKHFMQKEIFEQARSLTDTIRGRVDFECGEVDLADLNLTREQARALNRIVTVACGTSYYSGLVGKFFIEQMARLNVEVDYGSEYRYRDPIIDTQTAILAITQSGETVDTLAAMEEAHAKHATLWSIINNVGSQAMRVSDGTITMNAGPEIGVASTKAFTASIVDQYLLALHLGNLRGTLTTEQRQQYALDLGRLPDLVGRALEAEPEVKELAALLYHYSDFLYLGRGINYPIALEGALKLKEISYIHAEGYPAGEMKHGPIALIDDEMPVLCIALKDSLYEKMISQIEQAKARGGIVIAIATEGDTFIASKADHVLYIPETPTLLSPVVAVIPLQLLAYHIAVLRGADVDQPRNLAKSVTVE